MNKKIFFTIALTAVIFLSSCLTSLHRLTTYTTVVADNRVIGNWQYEDMQVKIESIPGSQFLKEISTSIVTKDEKTNQEKKPVYDSKEDSLLYTKSYVATFNKNDYQYYMICSLVRLGDELYADIEPIEAKPLNKPTEKDMDDLFKGGSYISSHSIAKLVINGNEIKFRFLDTGFITDQLKNGRVALKYETDDLFNTSLITSSSKDLQQFLTKYGKDERLYSKENTITLKKI